MERMQPSEVATFAIGLVGAFLLLQALRGRPFAGYRRHLAGAGLVLAAQVFTIAEGLAWNPVFNFLEHLALALAGLVFFAAAGRPARAAGAGGERGRRRDP